MIIHNNSKVEIQKSIWKVKITKVLAVNFLVSVYGFLPFRLYFTTSCRPLRKLITIFVFAFCCAASSFAQQCIPLHETDYGASGIDEGLDVMYTSDRGAIIAGRTTSNSQGGFDAFLMKLTEQGAIVWSKNYGGISDDALIRVIQTVDGGYVAIGTTNSYGHPEGEPFVLKTDAAGNLQWSRTYLPNNTGKHRATAITALRDGGYAITINLDDGAANSDALILKLDASGILQWSRSFDNGKADGFNSISEKSDTLVVGGFSELGPYNESNGIVAELSSSTGQLFQTFSIRRIISFQGPQVWNNKVVMVQAIPGGIAFTTQARLNGNDPADFRSVTHFKRMNNGAVVYERNIRNSTVFGSKMDDIRVSYTGEGGFVHLESDSAGRPYSAYRYIGPMGLFEHGRRFSDIDNYDRIVMKGIATTGNDGFLAVGGLRKNIGNDPLKIRVRKMDRIGAVGSCTQEVSPISIDSSQHLFANYSWTDTKLFAGTSVSSLALGTAENGFAVIEQCKDSYCFDQSTIPDNCSPGFLADLKSDDGFIVTVDMIPAIDGGMIGAGTLRKVADYQPLIVKLKSSGAVEWTYSLDKFVSGGVIYKIHSTKDGNYLAMATVYNTAANGSNRYALIIKLTPNGQLLWSRKFTISGNFTFNDIISADDGGYYAIATSGFGFPPTENFLIRLRPDGTVAWKKRSYSFTGSPTYKSILLDGNNLYISGDYQQNAFRFRVEKRNATSGDLIWHERVNLPYATNIFLKNMVVSHDTLYVVMTARTQASAMYDDIRTMVVKFTTGGKLANGYMLSSLKESPMAMNNFLYVSDPKPMDVMITDDRHIIVSQQMEADGKSGLAITKFSPDGKGVFSVLYPDLPDYFVQSVRQNGNNILLTGRKFFPVFPKEFRTYSAFVMNVDSTGKISSNDAGVCATLKLPFAIAPLDEVLSEWKDLDSVGNASYPIDASDGYDTKPVRTIAKLICSVSSTCSTIEINGKDSICDLSGIYRYTALKNEGCTSPVLWSIDSTQARIISKTDSTIDLQFLKGGMVSLTTRLSTECQSLGDQMEIFVPAPIASLNLGADTSVCSGAQFILRAGTGYASYRWHDGSTDSVFTVKAAGTYFVRVNDYCGGEKIDSIRVSTSALIQVDAGPDRQICLGDSAQLNAPAGFINYSWKTVGSSQIQILPNIVVTPVFNSTYILTAERSPGCLALDTIFVSVVSAKAITLVNDTSICIDKPITLDAGAGYQRYQWSNGAQTQKIAALTQGIYTIVAIDQNGCIARDTFLLRQVYPNPRIGLYDLNSLCEATLFTYEAPTAMRSYNWSDGSTGRTMTVRQPGIYWLSVVDQNGCEASDTTEIKSITPKVRNFLPEDLEICSYEVLTIRPKRDFVRYIWSTGENTRNIEVKSAGSYWLAVTDVNGCISNDTILIKNKECPKGFYTPNVFTPNNDGKNDRFKPIIFGRLLKYDFQIFNQFGEVVFQSKDPSIGWDGTVKGQIPSMQTFAWRCVYQYEGEAATQAKGTVTIVR